MAFMSCLRLLVLYLVDQFKIPIINWKNQRRRKIILTISTGYTKLGTDQKRPDIKN